MIRCKHCGASVADYDIHFPLCPRIRAAFDMALDGPPLSSVPMPKVTRLDVDRLGRKICHCGAAPVAYRGRCKKCSATDIRERRARKRRIACR